MKKNNKKMKGFSKRVLALMLCCFCLLATVPIYAFTTETEETQTTEESISEQQSESSSESLLSLSSETSESQTEADTQQSTSDEIIEPILENETDTEVEAEVDSETGTEVNPETETETDTADSETEAGTEAEVNTETGTETNTETETETDAAGNETETGSEAEVNAETESEADSETESETDATDEAEPSYLEQLNTYYNQAVAAGPDADDSVYAEIYHGAMAVYATAGSPSAEDDPDIYNAVGMIVMTLQGYGYDPYAVSTLEVRDIQYYRGDVDVYWDETNGTTTVSESHITSLTLNGMSVLKADSSKGSGWSGTPSQVNDYYTSASASNDQSVKLSITPADGYYVTRVTVACCPSTVTPYNCTTWKAGNAFDSVLSITAGGTITMDLSVVAFCHDNNNRENSHQYFILVQTAPLPSPLYVEYDYGEIVDILTNAGLTSTPFDSPATWTSVGSASDYYGSFTETDTLKFKQTENTQYMYRYANGDEDDAADWTHTSNYITEAADLAAAEAGYYFSHWEAQYYEECTATAVTNPTYNNYTYSFSETYGSHVVYKEGVDVSMVTNVKLVAQWVPISLKVTKTVDGLSEITEHARVSQTYQLKLQKEGADGYDDLQTTDYTIAGDGTLTYTFAASGANVTQVITPGTYKVVETGSYDLTGSTDNAYCTTTYPVQTVEVTADGTVKELKVLNTYSSTPATYNLTVQKTVSGNMYDANKEFAFTVTYGDETKTFNLKKDGSCTIENIPVGVNVTVTESPDGYTYSFVSITEGVTKTDTTNGVSFTMPSQDVTVVINNDKTVTIDTGIVSDMLPFVILLGVCVVGAVVMIRRREV